MFAHVVLAVLLVLAVATAQDGCKCEGNYPCSQHQNHCKARGYYNTPYEKGPSGHCHCCTDSCKGGGGGKCCYDVSKSKCQEYKGQYMPQKSGCGSHCKCCYECFIFNIPNDKPCYNAPGYHSRCRTDGYKCCGGYCKLRC